MSNAHYTGHHDEHRALQAHSVGDIYPWIVRRETHATGDEARDFFRAVDGRTGEQSEVFNTYDGAEMFGTLRLRGIPAASAHRTADAFDDEANLARIKANGRPLGYRISDVFGTAMKPGRHALEWIEADLLVYGVDLNV